MRDKPSIVTFNKNDKEIPDLYQVKYRAREDAKEKWGYMYPEQRKWKFGIVDKYSKEAEKEWKKGNLIIEDAITGQRWAIQTSLFEIWDIPISFSADEYHKFVEGEFQKALKTAKKAKGMVGKMLRMGVGDGYAFYIVTKETSKNATIEWRGFGGDRYVDQFLGGGGTFPKSRIVNLVD
jgi:hypothetical protein